MTRTRKEYDSLGVVNVQINKVESRFPYCDNWKEKYSSTKNENNVNNK